MVQGGMSDTKDALKSHSKSYYFMFKISLSLSLSNEVMPLEMTMFLSKIHRLSKRKSIRHGKPPLELFFGGGQETETVWFTVADLCCPSEVEGKTLTLRQKT